MGIKNTRQVIREPAQEKVHEVLRSQKFSTDRAKNNCLRAVYFPKKKKPGKPFYGLLGEDTDYELPAEQLFFPAVTFCGRCAILPKRNGKNFRRKKLKYCIRSR